MSNIIRNSLATFLFTALTAHAAVAQFKDSIRHYYDYYNASTRAKHAGKTDSAIYYARLAMNADPANRNPYQYLSGLLIKNGAYTEAVGLLETNILMGATPPEKFAYLFDNYDSVKGRPEIIALEKKIPRLQKEYYRNSYNHAFASMIYTMLGRDQAIRGRADKIYGDDSTKIAESRRIQAYLDTAVNMPELVAYLSESGFPPYREMDDAVSQGFHLIIHHLIAGCEGPAVVPLHQLVQTAVYTGRYPAYAYMLALDWGAINKTGKQIYGTYIGSGPDGVTTFYPPIENVADVDGRRAKWKVEPLSEVPFSDWRNPKLPEGYKGK